MNRADTRRAAERFAALLGDALDFSDADRSYSPFFSDIGLGIDEHGGIACVYLHYNRQGTTFLQPFLRMPEPTRPHECTATGITQRFPSGSARIAFCGHNTWVVDCSGVPALEFNSGEHEGFTERRCARVDGESTCIIEGYLPTIDPRDTDATFPIIIGLRIVKGTASADDGIDEALRIEADAAGDLVLVFSLRVLEVDAESILSRVRESSTSFEDARERTLAWWAEALGGLDCDADSGAESRTLARAAYALLSNSAASPGLLGGRICQFPSRGTYPTAYLWDSCFQNLGTELFRPALAGDSLLLFVDNLRVDGKLPAFICSTWVHPQQSQPPLLGWAGRRLVDDSGDSELAAQLLNGLRRNTRWWLSQRMTRFGLIAAANGMELGWDDTPRFDRGPIVACDLNSYLLVQMRACAEFAELIGDAEAAREHRSQADEYAARLVDTLYDEEAGLFWDLNLELGAPERIMTPACFLPLLGDVPLAERQVRRMVADYLLNPDHFFADVPFPVVAYSEPAHTPDSWWRGPTWMNVAYLMVQVLEKTGYPAEAMAARERLYGMMVADGDLREHFDSRTGKGLGAYEYGWTAAICLRFRDELAGKDSDE